MLTTTQPPDDRVTAGLLRALAAATGGKPAGERSTLVWVEHGRQVTLHLGYGRHRTYIGIDRIENGPRSASATAKIAAVFATYEADYSRTGTVYAAALVPTRHAPLVLLHLVAIETGATFTIGARA